MKKRVVSLTICCLALISAFVLNSCGSSSSGPGLSDISLSSVPSASTMLAGNGTYGVSKGLFSPLAGALDLQTVSGTPPYLKDLNSTNSLTYFWNGVVATINTAGSCSVANRAKFWGTDTSTPGGGGHGACMMAQGTGEALSRMMEGTSTICYMKGIGSSPTGVTVSSGAASDAFKQTASDKVVKVAVTNINMGGGRANMDVFFRVYGSDSVGDKYKYLMWMCRNNSLTQRETLEVDKANGTLTVDSSSNEDSARGVMNITAYLKNDGGTITFDKSKSRIATSKWTGSFGTYLGKVEITSEDLIKASRYSYNSTWGYNKTYSVAAFAGSSPSNFRFLQGCFTGKNSPANLASTWSWSGITEYRDTYYAAVSSSSLSAQCDAFDFTTDALFADPTVPAFDSTGLSCTTTPDITVTMDFSASGVAAIQSACEDDRRTLQNWSMCDSNAVRTAEGYCRN